LCLPRNTITQFTPRTARSGAPAGQATPTALSNVRVRSVFTSTICGIDACRQERAYRAAHSSAQLVRHPSKHTARSLSEPLLVPLLHAALPHASTQSSKLPMGELAGGSPMRLYALSELRSRPHRPIAAFLASKITPPRTTAHCAQAAHVRARRHLVSDTQRTRAMDGAAQRALDRGGRCSQPLLQH